MRRTLPLLPLLWFAIQGAGCAYVYSPMVRSAPPRAPATLAPDEGDLHGGVLFYPSSFATLAGTLGGSVPVGHDVHLELGGNLGPQWAMGHGGIRKTFRGPLDGTSTRPVADLAVGGGAGVGGGYSAGGYYHDGQYQPGPLEAYGDDRPWTGRFAAGLYADVGVGAQFDSAVTPFGRGRVTFSHADGLPHTLWLEIGGGVSIHPGRGPVGIHLSASYLGYFNAADRMDLIVVGTGLSVNLGGGEGQL